MNLEIMWKVCCRLLMVFSTKLRLVAEIASLETNTELHRTSVFEADVFFCGKTVNKPITILGSKAIIKA
ncbi:hypothetical protein BBH88_05100 [Planococcus antarcticus DSM 14505]|uniref:Uncharacterized protein n=1 Tax=Planococcus antarcticus DSM 14505 TaxID=1185653 RepID=A0ABM6D2I4_9BACL|nr:hypothetical protein BBH88_05100 [Planococcus antarcticus DSM 14505]